jgi:hypothetical protein
MSNSKLSEHFLALARDLDVMEPKVPEDVYKSHLIGARVWGYLARARAVVAGPRGTDATGRLAGLAVSCGWHGPAQAWPT